MTTSHVSSSLATSASAAGWRPRSAESRLPIVSSRASVASRGIYWPDARRSHETSRRYAARSLGYTPCCGASLGMTRVREGALEPTTAD